jgi:hypothetical protein
LVLGIDTFHGQSREILASKALIGRLFTALLGSHLIPFHLRSKDRVPPLSLPHEASGIMVPQILAMFRAPNPIIKMGAQKTQSFSSGMNEQMRGRARFQL